MNRPGNFYEELHLLSMEISESEASSFRIYDGASVRYITIQPEVYDYDEVLTYPPALLAALRPLPPGSWTSMEISRTSANQIEHRLNHAPLPGVQHIWHANMVDVLSVPEKGMKTPRVRIVQYKGRLVIAKMARFEWEVPYVEDETIVYQTIDGLNIGPKFLGHLTENGRVMGFLIEYVKGRHAVISDLDTCRSLAGRLHAAGFVHGDLNKYNFVIQDSAAWLIDFECASDYDDDEAAHEVSQLSAQLLEESGRGSVVTCENLEACVH